MKKTVYEVLSKVFGIVLVLVGIGALIGGLFAHNYVTSQLKQENITMPTADQVKGLPQASQDALKPFFGKQMTTGGAAQVYANNYIWEHMQESCKNVKDAQGNAVPPVPEEKCNYAGIGSMATDAKDPAAKAAYTAARSSNFQGDSLRSMLLTAYAFWLVGTIALTAGIACLILGLALIALGYLYFAKRNQTVVADQAVVVEEPTRQI